MMLESEYMIPAPNVQRLAWGDDGSICPAVYATPRVVNPVVFEPDLALYVANL